MLKNIEAKAGKTLPDFAKLLTKSGLTKHGELRSMLMEKFELGHGQANMVVHLALKSDGQSAAAAPKKGSLSYRRKKQFVRVGPKTKTAIDVGLAAKSLPADSRLKEMPSASMCRYTSRVSSAAEVDAALRGWIKTSYDEAG